MLDDPAASLAQILPWQAGQWQKLRSQIDAGKFAHALLIAGVPGIGKLQFALAARNYLLCEQPSQFACGECRSCTLLSAQTHADFVTLQPEEPGKVIRVDQVRELSQFVAQTAQRSGRKVVLLTPADALNINAANALLKSLEEPTPDTYFLLLCAVPRRLPATIRSRCQTLTLATPAPDIALAWLTEQLDDGAAARRRLQLMRGRPCAALVADDEHMQIQQAVCSGVQAVAQSRAAMPAVVEQWSKLPLQLLLERLANYLADSTRFALAAQTGAEIDSDERQAYARISQQVPVERLFAVYAAAQDVLKRLHHGGNPNKQLALEALLIEFHTSSSSRLAKA
ncbi:MAG: DNA polymerase III subunit delta' [Pseudomonadales bacterium]